MADRSTTSGCCADTTEIPGGVALVAGLGILALFGAIETLVVAGFALGVPVTIAHLPLGLTVSLAAMWFGSRSLGAGHCTQRFWRAVAVVLGSTAILAVAAAHIYDVSWDGLGYHQVAAIRMAQGWNPLTDPRGLTLHTFPKRVEWITSYPKGAWIPEAAFYKVFGHIEAAKALNSLVGVAAALLTFGLCLNLDRTRPLAAVAFAVAVAACPVGIVQASTFYVDARLGYLLFCAVVGIALLCRLGPRAPLPTAIVALSLALVSTTKLTGLVYACVVAAGIGAAVVVLKLFAAWRRPLFAAIAAIAAAALLVGVNPYVTNTVFHQSPFYPVAGPGARDLLANQIPPNLAHADPATRLIVSSFSAVQMSEEPQPTRLKVPFSVQRSDLRAFATPGARVGGFGPFFGGLLLLSLVTAAMVARNLRRQRDSVAAVAFGLAILVVLTALSGQQTSWARYVPQFWAVPLLIAGAATYGNANRPRRGLATAILAVALANSAFVAWGAATGQIAASRHLRAEIAELRLQGTPIVFDFQGFDANRVRFAEAQLPYVEVTSPPPGTVGRELAGTRGIIYTPDNVPAEPPS